MSRTAGAEILWDEFGVPHLFSGHSSELFHAFGWAQAQAHGELVLKLYAQARGRAAEYFGPAQLDSDSWVVAMGIPDRARAWYAAQATTFCGYLDAFASGINEHAQAHADRLSPEAKRVLPVDAVDVLAHTHRTISFSFVVDSATIAALARGEPRGDRAVASNAWAIGPGHSASGHAMLLTNPHLPWVDRYTCFEAHLNGPGINAYGITLAGFPVLTMAFNEHLGWAHTTNPLSAWTLYELETTPDGYLMDGEACDYRTAEHRLCVRQTDGSYDEAVVPLKWSVHGPVLEVNDRTLALRVAGLDRPGALEQWWEMALASDLGEFESALRRMRVPMFTVMYADNEGHVMSVFNGFVPKRRGGDFAEWDRIVPGNTAENIWADVHDYDELPRIVDPSSGWLQNANDPPWTSTIPPVLDPDNFPPYIAPRGPMGLRAQRSARAVAERGPLSLQDLVELKQDTTSELADRVLDPLIEAARRHGGEQAIAAGELLSAWSRCTDADSRGAVLFVMWASVMDRDAMFAVPWDESDPLETPRGLADPVTAVKVLVAVANYVEETYGSIDVEWGAVFRLSAEPDLIAANGADGVGVLQELWFLRMLDDRFVAAGGDCYTAAVEFGDPVRAMVLTTCGNTSQPPTTNQKVLMSRKEMRPALLTRREILDHLARRETVIRSG